MDYTQPLFTGTMRDTSTSVNIVLVLVRRASPMRGISIVNAEHKLAMYALATDRPGRLEYQVHGTRRAFRTGQVSHGRMVWPS